MLIIFAINLVKLNLLRWHAFHNCIIFADGGSTLLQMDVGKVLLHKCSTPLGCVHLVKSR
jgi:hypothetical protein